MTLAGSTRPTTVPSWLGRYATLGADRSDSEEVRVQKALLTLSATLMASLATVWVVTYAAIGLWPSAAVPLAYQLASAASIAAFAMTHRYHLFRTTQLGMSMLLPFALQWSLGGFETSSAVSLWGFMAPLGALLFLGVRQAWMWFGAYALLVAISGAVDPTLASDAPHVPRGVVITFFVLNVVAVGATAFALLQFFVRARDREQAKSERLLLNVLPAPVAARLKDDEGVIADGLADVTVLFADIVGFTPLAEGLPASDVVTILDQIFASWDELATRLGLEKIKTIGDAYMVAGGVPLPTEDHMQTVAEMALLMRAALERVSTQAGLALEARIGIDAGPVVAGVIGRTKFSYDLWGDTVNTASRMESHAPRGSIQVTERVYERLRTEFTFAHRGTIDVKGKGPMATYLLEGRP